MNKTSVLLDFPAKKKKYFFVFCASCLLFFGCKFGNEKESASTAQGLSSDGQSVLMGLKSLTADDFPDVDFATFQAKTGLGNPLIDQSGKLPGRVIEMFAPTLRVQVYPLNSGALRKETFNLNSNISNSRLVQSGMSLALTPQLRGGAKIEVVRNFKDTTTASHALPFSFIQLPLSAELALALSEGTYVGIPLESSVALNVTGSFLAAHGSSDRRLYDFLNAGSSGSFSGTVQGALLATGQWRLQILRLAGNKVRVRVVEDDQESVSGGVGASGRSSVSYTFVPMGTLSRALDISKRVFNVVRAGNNRLLRNDAQPLPLSPQLKKARELAAILPVQSSEAQQFLEAGIKKADRAFEMAKEKPESIQLRIDSGTNQQLSQIRSRVKTKIDSMSSLVQRVTSATYCTDAAILLNAEFSRRHRFIADYVFDLSSAEAKIAYEHAVSGRSLWLGAQPSGLKPETGLNNFIVAERLALEDAGEASPRVLRNVLGESRMRSRRVSIQFSGLMASTGFSESWKNNAVYLKDSQGQTTTWNAALWQFDRNLKVINSLDSEQLASGLLLSGSSDAVARASGNYWFAWKRRLPKSRSTGMQEIFTNAMNYLGPLAFASNLPSYYKGEFEGDKEASMLVFFSKNAMQALFDEKRVTDEVLWKALGRVALSFDNTFGLPFNAFGSLPGKYAQVPAAVEACEIIKKNWGAAYCSFFGNEFLPKFSSARMNADAWQRLKVFESFYGKGFLANKIGARLLVRFLTEVVVLTFGKDAAREVAIQLIVNNATDASAFASPSFVSATPPDELQVLESLGLMM